MSSKPANHRISTLVFLHGIGIYTHLYAGLNCTENTPYAGMQELFAVAALSRLIHPTTVGGRYCAKIFDLGADKYCVEAVQFRGLSPDVIIGPRKTDWLSEDDAAALRGLMPWLAKRMHERIHRAYWNHEYAMRTYYLDARWTFVVSGLEALINIDEKDCGWQFRDRCIRLATLLGIDLTDEQLHSAYALRSKLVHAEGFLFSLETIMLKSDQLDLYDKLEALLRATVLKCLQEEDFGNNFSDNTAVEKAWPLRPKPRK